MLTTNYYLDCPQCNTRLVANRLTRVCPACGVDLAQFDLYLTPQALAQRNPPTSAAPKEPEAQP